MLWGIGYTQFAKFLSYAALLSGIVGVRYLEGGQEFFGQDWHGKTVRKVEQRGAMESLGICGCSVNRKKYIKATNEG